MKKKRFMEEQIIGILREQEAGAKVADLARQYAVSEIMSLGGKRLRRRPDMTSPRSISTRCGTAPMSP